MLKLLQSFYCFGWSIFLIGVVYLMIDAYNYFIAKYVNEATHLFIT